MPWMSTLTCKQSEVQGHARNIPSRGKCMLHLVWTLLVICASKYRWWIQGSIDQPWACGWIVAAAKLWPALTCFLDWVDWNYQLWFLQRSFHPRGIWSKEDPMADKTWPCIYNCICMSDFIYTAIEKIVRCLCVCVTGKTYPVIFSITLLLYQIINSQSINPIIPDNFQRDILQELCKCSYYLFIYLYLVEIPFVFKSVGFSVSLICLWNLWYNMFVPKPLLCDILCSDK